jgi:hypothetical protein
MSSMVFLSFVVVADTISLFEWNINHFTAPNLGYELEDVNMFLCKFIAFVQYYSLEASGFLLSFMTIDRFVAIRSMPGSFYSKLPFNSTRSAYLWCVGIITVLAIINCHILILNGYYNDPEVRNRTVYNTSTNGQFVSQLTERYVFQDTDLNCYKYKTGFLLYPQWDAVHMFLYSFVPASIMVIFNSLLIITTLLPAKGDTSRKSQKAQAKKRKLTVSLVSISLAFVVLTLPATIGWGYMSWLQDLPHGYFTLTMMDHFLFLNHASVFFTCLLSNYKFRKVILGFVRRSVGLPEMVASMNPSTNVSK